MDEWNNPWTPEYQELRDRVPLPDPELSSAVRCDRYRQTTCCLCGSSGI